MNDHLFVFTTPIERFFKLPIDCNIFWKNKYGRYLGANDHVTTLADTTHNNIIKQQDRDLPWHDTATKLEENDRYTLQNGTTQVYYEAAHLDILYPMLSFKSPLQDANNHIVGTFGIAFFLDKTPMHAILELINKYQIMPKSLLSLIHTAKNDMSLKQFTKREIECMYYLVRGNSAKETGAQLNISPKTVESYISQLKLKLRCYSRSQLIGKIVDSGLLHNY